LIVEKQIFFRDDYLDSKIEDELYDDSKENEKKLISIFGFFIFISKYIKSRQSCA